jgi:signal peptidase I
MRDSHKHSLAAEVLRNTGKLRLVARGHSMLPALWPRDLLTIEATTFDRVDPGDVVLFAREDRFFIHRILRRWDTQSGSSRPSLVTRGDSMPQADTPVLPEELLGRVISVERRADRIFPVPRCSWWRRSLGLMLGYGDRLRSVALRVQAWRARNTETNSDFLPQETQLG